MVEIFKQIGDLFPIKIQENNMKQKIDFSPRENQVIDLLIQGKSNKEMSVELGISVRTVEFHLSNIYKKLDVTSRTEAVIRLTEITVRESTGSELREATVTDSSETSDNGEINLKRRFSMKKILSVVVAVVTIVGGVVGVMDLQSTPEDNIPATIEATLEHSEEFLSDESTSVSNSREVILDQIQELVETYDLAVQVRKNEGTYIVEIDESTGQDLIIFTGDSEYLISELYYVLTYEIQQLNELYTQMYRQDIQPTPFPTQSSDDENSTYYDSLVSHANAYCPGPTNSNSISIFHPVYGKNIQTIIGDDYASCLMYSQMMKEWENAPFLNLVEFDKDIEMLQMFLGNPSLELTFENIMLVANAPWFNAAIYSGNKGIKYHVEIESGVLAIIEPEFGPVVDEGNELSREEINAIALEFILSKSLNYSDLKDILTYEETCNELMCFYTWRYDNNDWSMTDWRMMAPFFQIAIELDGDVFSIINTLDLVKR